MKVLIPTYFPFIGVRVIAESDANLKIYADHFRKKELEQPAKEANCQLIALERDKNSMSKK